MTPGEHNIIEATMRLIDAIFGREDLIIGIGVILESLRVNDLIGEFAAND